MPTAKSSSSDTLRRYGESGLTSHGRAGCRTVVLPAPPDPFPILCADRSSSGDEGCKTLRLVLEQVEVVGRAVMTGDADGEPAGAGGENGLAVGERAYSIRSSEFRHANNVVPA